VNLRWSKSLLGVSRDPLKKGENPLNVINVMMPTVISVSPETSVRDAIKLMLQHRISGLPVVDEEQALVGILTEGDLLRRTEIGTERKHNRWLSFLLNMDDLAVEYVRAHSRKVGEIMTPAPIITARENTPLEKVAGLMEKHNIKRLPVMRGTKVIGIISRADFIRAVMNHGTAMRGPAKSDQYIRAQIIEKIRMEHWSPFSLVDVEVSDGCVRLKGVVSFQHQRDALKVVAKNTPGVKEVIDELTWAEPSTGLAVSR
jgi:CBS domain-containing protein